MSTLLKRSIVQTKKGEIIYRSVNFFVSSEMTVQVIGYVTV